MIGKGPEKNNLRIQSEKLGISEKVKFLAWLERDEVLKVMQESSIFLFPSAEGGGMVVLEAMACGLPVVCLDYGGPGEMVGEDSGLCISIGAHQEMAKELATALKRLHDDSDLRESISTKAKARVASKYLWDCKSKIIGIAYERVI
jgi:glycosyltransferase involved in cell wall biosynthesis